jgi:RNA recognition motif-containing protein
MSTPEEAQEAIRNLNDFDFHGSRITVEASTGKRNARPGGGGAMRGPPGRYSGRDDYRSVGRGPPMTSGSRSGGYDRRDDIPVVSSSRPSAVRYDYESYYGRAAPAETSRSSRDYYDEYYARYARPFLSTLVVIYYAFPGARMFERLDYGYEDDSVRSFCDVEHLNPCSLFGCAFNFWV